MENQIRELLEEKPEYKNYLQRILGWHKNDYEDVRGYRKEPAINTQACPIRTTRLTTLSDRGILSLEKATGSKKIFKLKNPEAVEVVLEEKERAQKSTEVKPVTEEEIPDDLFDVIVGYEDLKWMFRKSINSNLHHVLMKGPPATAKTVFLLELGRLPNSEYVLGHSATSPGLTEELFKKQPRYVLIDEIDKMDKDDFGALLSLMETGKVKETKSGKKREMTLNANVYAACNRTTNIPRENLDRFETLELEEYSATKFVKVTTGMLTKREDVDIETAEHIAYRVLDLNKDVRKAIRIARVCDSEEEIDRYVEMLKNY